jgi:hypothetical protein
LPIRSIELILRGYDIICDNGVIEPADPGIDLGKVYILKFPSHDDYNSIPVFYLRSNLGSNFIVQTLVTDSKTESETIPNINIFMDITKGLLPHLPITYIQGDYKNEAYSSILTYRDSM